MSSIIWCVAPSSPTVIPACVVKAKKKLATEGINIRVVDIHTIKPIDKELIVKCAIETQKVITVEDHNIIGGLGSAVCEVSRSRT